MADVFRYFVGGIVQSPYTEIAFLGPAIGLPSPKLVRVSMLRRPVDPSGLSEPSNTLHPAAARLALIAEAHELILRARAAIDVSALAANTSLDMIVQSEQLRVRTATLIGGCRYPDLLGSSGPRPWSR